MAELIMNQSGKLGHGSGSAISGGVFSIVSAPSVKNKIENKGIFRGPLKFTFSGGNAAGFQPGTVATISPVDIPPTAVKTKADGFPVIRLGDSVVMACQGTSSTPPNPTAGISGPAEVSDAGQSKVRGD